MAEETKDPAGEDRPTQPVGRRICPSCKGAKTKRVASGDLVECGHCQGTGKASRQGVTACPRCRKVVAQGGFRLHTCLEAKPAGTDLKLGITAHRAYTTAMGKPWTDVDWATLTPREQWAWVDAANTCCNVFAASVMR